MVYDTTNVTEGFSFKSGLAANYDNTALPTLLNNRGSVPSDSPATWINRAYTFTTGEDTTKVAFLFKDDYEGYFLDDITVTNTVEVGMPVITTTTTGADNKNGGLAWVEVVGDNFVFKAVP